LPSYNYFSFLFNPSVIKEELQITTKTELTNKDNIRKRKKKKIQQNVDNGKTIFQNPKWHELKSLQAS
jgi:hypothetical protein